MSTGSKGSNSNGSQNTPSTSQAKDPQVSMADLQALSQKQKELQATLDAQTQEFERRRKEALDRGERDRVELQKQLDKQYADHKARMAAISVPAPDPSAPNQIGTPRYMVDFSTIPVFSGDSAEDGVTVEDFLCAVEGVAAFHDFTPKDLLALLQAKTRRAAHRFVGLLTAEDKASLGALKKAFYKEYKIPTPRSALEAQFSECKQRRYESVAEFYHRLLSVAHKLEVATPAPPGADVAVFTAMWEDRRINRFLAGLRAELRRAMIGREPKTLQEARSMAVSAEEVETAAQAEEHERTASTVSALRTGFDYRSRLEQLKQEELALMEARVSAMRLSSAPQDGTTPQAQRNRVHWRDRSRSKSPKRAYQFHSDGARPSNTSCFLCQEEGHWVSDCPLKMCGRCGQKGHLPRNCPSVGNTPKN
jgi:hypothetical protein